jgi:signal transduction histidine kinase
MQTLIDWFLFQENAEQKARQLRFSTLYLSLCMFLLSTAIFGVHFFYSQSQLSLVAGLTTLVTSIALYFINNLWVTRGIFFCYWLIYIWLDLNLWPLPLIEIFAFCLMFSRFILNRLMSAMLYIIFWLVSLYIDDLFFVRDWDFIGSIFIIWITLDYIIVNGFELDTLKKYIAPLLFIVCPVLFLINEFWAIINDNFVSNTIILTGILLGFLSIVLGYRLLKSKPTALLEAVLVLWALAFYLFLLFQYKSGYFIFAVFFYLYFYLNIKELLLALIANLSLFFVISSIVLVLEDLSLALMTPMFAQILFILGGFYIRYLFEKTPNTSKIMDIKALKDRRFWFYFVMMLVPVTLFAFAMASSYIHEKNVEYKSRQMVSQAYVTTRWQSVTALTFSQFNKVLEGLSVSNDLHQTLSNVNGTQFFRIAEAKDFSAIFEQFSAVSSDQFNAGYYDISDRLFTIKLIPNKQHYLIRENDTTLYFKYFMPKDMDWFVKLSDKIIVENNEQRSTASNSPVTVEFSLDINELLPHGFSTQDKSLVVGMYFEPVTMSSFLRANPIACTLYILVVMICFLTSYLITSRHQRLLELKQLDFYNPQNTETLKRVKRLRQSFQQTKTEVIQRVDFKTREKLLSIIGLLEQVFESKKPSFAFAENQYDINEAIQYVHHSVENMLEISKLDQSTEFVKQEEWFEISLFTDELFKSYAELFKQKGLRFKVDLKDHLNTVFFDKKLLKSILVKLLDNALHFTHKGGVTLTFTILNQRLNLTLIDTGVGMDALLVKQLNELENEKSELLEHELFSSLFIAHVLVKSLKGHMKFFSTLNKGTQVNLSFPISRFKNDESAE